MQAALIKLRGLTTCARTLTVKKVKRKKEFGGTGNKRELMEETSMKEFVYTMNICIHIYNYIHM